MNDQDPTTAPDPAQIVVDAQIYLAGMKSRAANMSSEIRKLNDPAIDKTEHQAQCVLDALAIAQSIEAFLAEKHAELYSCIRAANYSTLAKDVQFSR